MGNENQKTDIIEAPEQEQVLSQEEKDKAVSSELALIPDADKKEVEKVIKTEDVLTINKHKTKVSSFKRRFPASKFDFKGFDPEDTENKKLYEKALEAWREIKNWRTKIFAPDVKALKEPYRKLLDYYIAATGPVEAELKKLEVAPGDFVDKWEAAEKEFKQKEARELEERTNKRVNDIIAAGAAFDNEYYSIGSEEFGVKQISLGMDDINAMTDTAFAQVFEQIIAGAKIIAEKDAEKTAAALIKEEQEKEQQKKDKEEIEKNRLESRSELAESIGMVYDDVKDAWVYEQWTISKDIIKTTEKDEYNALFSTIKTQISAAKIAAKEKADKAKRLESRPKDLLALGMTYFGAKKVYSFDSIDVSDHYLETATDGAWEDCIADTKGKIEVITSRIEQERKRHNEVLALGYSFVNNFYYYKGIRFDLSTFINADADKWLETIEYLKKQPAEIDAAIELQNIRYSLLAPYATFGEQVDMQKLAELTSERFDALLASKKAAYDKKISADLETKRLDKIKKDAEALAASSDSEKWVAFKNALPVISEMQSEEYKGYADQAKTLMDKIKAIY